MKRFLRGWAIAFGKVIAVTTGSMLVLVAILYSVASSLFTLDIDHYRSHLPSTLRPASIEKDSYVFGLREGCGVTVLKLDKEVTAAIATQGLDFLNTDLVRSTSKHILEPWRPTPVENMEELETEPNPGINGFIEGCTPDFTKEEREEIYDKLRTTGGYWTKTHGLLLIIYPGFELMAFSSSG